MRAPEEQIGEETKRVIAEINRMLKEKEWKKDIAVKDELLSLLHQYGPQVIEHNLAKLEQPSVGTLARMLLTDYHGEDEFIRLAAIADIGALWLLEDEKLENCLIEMTRSSNPYDRSNAVQALITTEVAKKSGKAVPALVNILLNDKDGDIRASMAEQLGRITGDERIVDGLIKALDDEYFKDEDPTSLTSSRTPSVSERAVMSLIKIRKERGLAAIVPVLLRRDEFAPYTRQPYRQKTIDVLNRIGRQAVVPLIEALKTKDAACRERAVKALGGIRDPRAFEPLVEALMDKEWRVRSSAAWALGALTVFLQDVRAVRPLLKALKDKRSFVREQAKSTLKSVAECVRQLRILQRPEYAPGVEAFISALMDEDKGVRILAAEALGVIGGEKAIEPLTQALKDKEKKVRKAVEKALEEIRKKE